MTTISLGEVARLADGTLVGDASVLISGTATLRDAKPGQITLADNPKLAGELTTCKTSAVVVPLDFQPEGIPYISVADVHKSFARIVAHFHPPRRQSRIGISPRADIHPTATVGQDVDIHPGVSIGEEVEIGAGSTIHPGACIMAGCRLGRDVVVFPNAVLYENTIVGDRTIIHAGAVIGAYGFGYDTVEGRHQLSAQLGFVEIGADVDIGACSTIDRGTYGPTVIGEGTKIDNQVMIAHNCRIGRHNFLCSHVGIAGSSTTGDYVVMAGQVGIGDHLQIGDQAKLGAKAGVMHDIPGGEDYVGIPATPLREQMIKQAAFAKLPEMRRQLRALQKKVDGLIGGADAAVKDHAA